MSSYTEYKSLLSLPGLSDLTALTDLTDDEAVFVLACADTMEIVEAFRLAFKSRAGYSPCEVAAAALLNTERIQAAFAAVLKHQLIGENEVLVRTARIARDDTASNRDRLQAMKYLMDALGTFSKGGETWVIKTKKGTAKEAVEALADELTGG